MTQSSWMVQRVRLISAALAILFAILLALSVHQQRIHIDEAWLGEQSYHQATEGERRSELFRGLLGYEDYIFVAHKLFIAMGALSIQMFGWHLWALRLVPLLSGALLLFMFFYYFRRSERKDLSPALLFALLYLLSAPLFFRFVNLYRPEVPLAACGFGSFLLLAEYVRDGQLSRLLAAAVLGGMGFLIHLNGVIYIGAGVVTLVWFRRWRHLVVFAVVSAGVSLLYFYDVIGHWDAFWYQFSSDPALDNSDLTWYAPFSRLVSEHKRLFRKPEVIFASLLLFSSLWYFWKSLPRSTRWIAVYAIALVVGLGSFAQGKTIAYTILLLPTSALIVAGATAHWLGRVRDTSRAVTAAFALLWLLFLGHSAYDNAIFAMTQKRDIAATNRMTASFIPRGASVLAPLDFIFEEIDYYQIRGDEAAGWIMRELRPEIGDIHKGLHAPDFLRYAADRKIEAVVLEDYLFTRIGLPPPAIGETVMGFVTVGKVEELSRTVLVEPSLAGKPEARF